MRTTATCHRSLCAALLVNALLAGDADPGVSRLRRMVVVGDSLLAGFGSGGFVGVGRPGQVDSAPAFVARRAQVRLPLPFLSAPGVPPPGSWTPTAMAASTEARCGARKTASAS